MGGGERQEGGSLHQRRPATAASGDGRRERHLQWQPTATATPTNYGDSTRPSAMAACNSRPIISEHYVAGGRVPLMLRRWMYIQYSPPSSSQDANSCTGPPGLRHKGEEANGGVRVSVCVAWPGLRRPVYPVRVLVILLLACLDSHASRRRCRALSAQCSVLTLWGHSARQVPPELWLSPFTTGARGTLREDASVLRRTLYSVPN